VLSYEDAAVIIGRHFREVQDKLLNILQLNSQTEVAVSLALVQASVEQKIKDIKPVPFTVAIDLSENKKYIPYLAIPVSVFLFIFLVKPLVLRQGTAKLVHYGTFYAKESPFSFIIENGKLNAIEQKDFTLKIKLKGNELPNEVYIEYEGNKFKVDKQSPNSFEYIFRDVQHDENFTLSAAGYESIQYQLKMEPQPGIVSFDAALHYPAYTGHKDEVLHNTGDFVIPEGTTVQWEFHGHNADNILLRFTDSSQNQLLAPTSQGAFTLTKRFTKSGNYSVSASNKYVSGNDSVNYAVQVIPDLYPTIEVVENKDTTSLKHLYFNGSIKDDYGFTRLAFIYKIYDKEDSVTGKSISKSYDISISKSTLYQPIFYYWSMDTLDVSPGQELEYYFEVWDNDGVNGPKSTKSKVMYFKLPTIEEIEKKTGEQDDHIQNEISKSIQQSYILESQMEHERADLYDKKELNWADKKKISDLLNKQLEMEKKQEEISKENKQNNEEKMEFKQKDSDLVQQQQELQKLFDQIANDSIKKKLQELQKMLDKMNKNEIQQELEKLSVNNQDFKKELERMLDLFKQAEFDQKLTDDIKRLDSLANKQEALSKETNEKKDSKGGNEDLQKKQDAINKDFQDVNKDLKDLEKKNEALDQPTGYKNPEDQEKSAQQDMQQSSEQLSHKKNSKASQSQHNASQKMEKMSNDLMAFQMDQQAQQEEANATSLRAILNNLVLLSFGEEDLLKQVSSLEKGTTRFTETAKKQKELQNVSRNIADSLYELSKKAPQIEGIVNQEMSQINYNMKEAISAMEDRQAQEAAGREQYAMTSVNNLALMLSEVLQSMQQQSNKMKVPGAGSCKKPGGKGAKPSMANIRQLQEQISKQLDQMSQALKSGKKPGGKSGKEGEKTSEQLAKLAAQQQYIREQMQEAEDQMNNKKQGAGELGDIANQMNKNEEDILNQQITEATLKRQQEILKHLLEYEKSERQQGQSPEFESHTAKKQYFGNQNQFLEYNILKTKQDEMLKTVPPDFNPFYKNKVESYFNSFNE
jgi:hypothetical protein